MELTLVDLTLVDLTLVELVLWSLLWWTLLWWSLLCRQGQRVLGRPTLDCRRRGSRSGSCRAAAVAAAGQLQGRLFSMDTIHKRGPAPCLPAVQVVAAFKILTEDPQVI